MSPNLQRAMLLLSQGRYELAEKEIRQSLTEFPNDAQAHAMLALCYLRRDDYDYQQAAVEAQKAIELAPDYAYAFYILALTGLERNRFNEAEAAIREAIQIEPGEADYFGVLASVKLSQSDWAGALSAAEHGLQIDASNSICGNLRTQALMKLGRADEAQDAVQASLSQNPDDAVTHATYGWSKLEQGKSDEAIGHFREALRLNPDMEYAQSGIVQAIKAKNFLFRWLMYFFVWMGRLQERGRWMVIIGLYVGFRVVRTIVKENEQLAPYLLPFIVLYIGFCVLTWIGNPIFNIFLRLHPVGKHALSREEVACSNWFLACLALAAVLAGVGFTLNYVPLLIGALCVAALLIPISAIYGCEQGWPRTWMIRYTLGLIALAVVYQIATLLVMQGNASPIVKNAESVSLVGFALGIFAGQFVANYLTQRQPVR